MRDRIAQLKHEIEELERQIAARPFGALFEKKRSDQLYHRLKKKRKELVRTEGPAPGAPDAPEAKPAPKPKPKAKPRAKPSVKKAVSPRATGKATGSKARAKSQGAKSKSTVSRPKAAAPKKSPIAGRTGKRKKT